jgi:hypothetical protein
MKDSKDKWCPVHHLLTPQPCSDPSPERLADRDGLLHAAFLRREKVDTPLPMR